MNGAESYSVREARRADLDAVVRVQHHAFGRVSRELAIDPANLPPMNETASDLEVLCDRGVRFFVAVSAKGEVIGSVRGEATESTVEVGRLVVEDGWQRRGVASALMDTLESAYPPPRRFELFTGADAAAPLALYRKRGYRQYRIEDLGHVVLVWLAKHVQPE